MKDILERLASGEVNVDEAEKLLKANNILEFDDIAQFDIKRNERTGFPEAIFSPSKDYDDLITIIRNYLENSRDDLIITKLSAERHERILDDLGENSFIFDYNKRAQILIIRQEITKKDPIAKIGIITAGTSDINIAEEARVRNPQAFPADCPHDQGRCPGIYCMCRNGGCTSFSCGRSCRCACNCSSDISWLWSW